MPHQWKPNSRYSAVMVARLDLAVVHSLTVPLGEYSLKEAVMIAANEPLEKTHGSTRMLSRAS
jgi:hypothetical protein